jgi:hypothetical protein
MPTAGGAGETGQLCVRVWLESRLMKTGKRDETTWDSIVVKVSAPDMQPVRIAGRFDPLQPAFVDTIDNIPPGANRLVEAWTCTKNGLQIHYCSQVVPSIREGQTASAVLNLRAVRGSIYINLADVPVEVDSVFAAFYFGADSLTAKDRRSAIMFLSIDNVPDSTAGTLVIRGTDVNGATMYSDTLALTFYTGGNETLQAQFCAAPGGLALSLSLPLPGVTVVSGAMAGPQQPSTEQGGCVISEIMYYTDGDSDYIEIHNPADTAFHADTLIIEIINTQGTTRIMCPSFVVPPGGFFVLGDSDAPAAWVDTVCAIDLPTTGRWILLKTPDGSVIDWVAYTKSDQEWPAGLKYHSIECSPTTCDPTVNNYGRNWTTVTAPVTGSNCFGTPGH